MEVDRRQFQRLGQGVVDFLQRRLEHRNQRTRRCRDIHHALGAEVTSQLMRLRRIGSEHHGNLTLARANRLDHYARRDRQVFHIQQHQMMRLAPQLLDGIARFGHGRYRIGAQCFQRALAINGELDIARDEQNALDGDRHSFPHGNHAMHRYDDLQRRQQF